MTLKGFKTLLASKFFYRIVLNPQYSWVFTSHILRLKQKISQKRTKLRDDFIENFYITHRFGRSPKIYGYALTNMQHRAFDTEKAEFEKELDKKTSYMAKIFLDFDQDVLWFENKNISLFLR